VIVSELLLPADLCPTPRYLYLFILCFFYVMRDRITAAAVNNKYEYLWAKNYGTKSFITVKYWYKYRGWSCPLLAVDSSLANNEIRNKAHLCPGPFTSTSNIPYIVIFYYIINS
jgi:hypothetical protein